MSATDIFDFLALPAELRLEIYRNLFKDCLANGYAADVAGLYRCCRQVHKELEAELMTTVRPLLIAKYKWKSAGAKHDMLSLGITPKLSAKAIKARLSVALPVDARDIYCEDNEAQKASYDLAKLTTSVQTMFVSPWSLLAFTVQAPDSGERYTFEKEALVFILLNRLSKTIMDSSSQSQHPERLVLDYRNYEQLAGVDVTRMFRCMLGHLRFRLGRMRSWVVRAWTSYVTTGDARGWRVTLDFKQNESAVKDALCMIEEVNGQREAKILYSDF